MELINYIFLHTWLLLLFLFLFYLLLFSVFKMNSRKWNLQVLIGRQSFESVQRNVWHLWCGGRGAIYCSVQGWKVACLQFVLQTETESLSSSNFKHEAAMWSYSLLAKDNVRKKIGMWSTYKWSIAHTDEICETWSSFIPFVCGRTFNSFNPP